MKCVCGYEHETGLDENNNWQDFLKGDERFINITGSTFMRRGEYHQDAHIYLHACPKCGTIKTEI